MLPQGWLLASALKPPSLGLPLGAEAVGWPRSGCYPEMGARPSLPWWCSANRSEWGDIRSTFPSEERLIWDASHACRLLACSPWAFLPVLESQGLWKYLGEAWSMVFLGVGYWLLLCDLFLVSLCYLSGKLPGTGEIFLPSILVPLGAWCNREHLNYCFPSSVKMRFLIAPSASCDIFLLFG